ncbi:MAG TPA: S-methyl-5-thioribose-1-phosphate isomerase [Polyangia bacterium]
MVSSPAPAPPLRPLEAGHDSVEVIDQTQLPHEVRRVRLTSCEDVARAIETMTVRGAPLIGVSAAYGLWLAMREDPSDAGLAAAHARLLRTRPTAVNLSWALDRVRTEVLTASPGDRAVLARGCADAILEEDVALCAAIGEHGLPLLEKVFHSRGEQRPVNVLTHCNAGWLATIEWGTALAPVYKAHQKGLPIHVYVDETRPRNQGASLTAWELGQRGIAHTVIADNAGGHLMQRGLVDVCLVGSDRTTARGDVCNKIGTYLKALAARAHDVPFYVGLPGPTIDWTITDGLASILIEERDGDEVRRVWGRDEAGNRSAVSIVPREVPVANPAFDVTPAALVSALITERGVCPATAVGLASLYPERAPRSAL